MDEAKKIIGREYLSSTKCDLDATDGMWKVISSIHDRVLFEGETEWVDESVEAMAIDTDCQKGIQTAMSSSLNYLVENVYQNGFNGLVEYRTYQKQLEEAKKTDTTKEVLN